jgi:hypothetical protein
MNWVFSLLFFISTGLWQISARANEELYRLNEKSGQCEGVETGLRPRSAIVVKDFPRMDKEFLENNPLCASAKTCLDYDRFESLIAKGALPRGLQLGSILSSDFKDKAAKACLHEPSGSALEEFAGALSRNYKTYPIETKMSLELVQKAKEKVDSSLKDSQTAAVALGNCLKLDVAYGSGTSVAEKKRRYESDLKTNPKLQNGCEALWEPDNEVDYLKQQLKQMRQTLLASKLLAVSASPEDLLKTAERMAKNEPLPTEQAQILKDPLALDKDGVFGFVQSEFWKDSPDQLAPPDSDEKKEFLSYLQGLNSRYPGTTLKEKLEIEKFKAVSENPLLIYIPSAKPTSAEISTAFSKQRVKWEALGKVRLEDVDYLNYPKALESTLKDFDPALRGDYCVLAEHMVVSRRKHNDVIPNLVQGVLLTEASVAAFAAKGIGKKVLAFIFGTSNQMDLAFAATAVQRSIEIRDKQLILCSQATKKGNGLCNVEELKNSTDKAAMRAAMAIFMATPNKYKSVVAPVFIGSEATKSKK